MPAVLLALMALAVPHGGDNHHDGNGLATVVVHDASDHSIGALSFSEERPDHCAVCQWTRTFRHQAEVAFLAALSTEQVTLFRQDDATPRGTGVATQPPLRAPPSSPTPV